MIVATEDVPTGEDLILSAAFEKDGEDAPGVANGVLSLYHGEDKVGDGRIKSQPGSSDRGRGPLRRSRTRCRRHGRHPGGRTRPLTRGSITQVTIESAGGLHRL